MNLNNLLVNQQSSQCLEIKDQLAESQVGVIVRFLDQHRHYQSINLRGNELTNRSIMDLLPVFHNQRNLKELNLSWNKLGISNDFNYINQLTSRLKSLDLKNNHLQMPHAVLLSQAIQNNCSLHRLDISWNLLGNQGVGLIHQALKNNHLIKELNVQQNQADQQLQIEIQKLLVRNQTMGQQQPSPTANVGLQQTQLLQPVSQQLPQQTVRLENDYQQIKDRQGQISQHNQQIQKGVIEQLNVEIVKQKDKSKNRQKDYIKMVNDYKRLEVELSRLDGDLNQQLVKMQMIREQQDIEEHQQHIIKQQLQDKETQLYQRVGNEQQIRMEQNVREQEQQIREIQQKWDIELRENRMLNLQRLHDDEKTRRDIVGIIGSQVDELEQIYKRNIDEYKQGKDRFERETKQREDVKSELDLQIRELEYENKCLDREMETMNKRHKEAYDKLHKEIQKRRDSIWNHSIKRAKSVYKREMLREDYEQNVRDLESLMREREQSKRQLHEQNQKHNSQLDYLNESIIRKEELLKGKERQLQDRIRLLDKKIQEYKSTNQIMEQKQREYKSSVQNRLQQVLMGHLGEFNRYKQNHHYH